MRTSPPVGTAGPEGPIGLWTRIDRLKERCRVALEPFPAAPGARGSLYWKVAIALSDSPPDTSPIVLVRNDPVEALGQSIEEAEARGWHVAPAPACGAAACTRKQAG